MKIKQFVNFHADAITVSSWDETIRFEDINGNEVIVKIDSLEACLELMRDLNLLLKTLEERNKEKVEKNKQILIEMLRIEKQDQLNEI